MLLTDLSYDIVLQIMTHFKCMDDIFNFCDIFKLDKVLTLYNLIKYKGYNHEQLDILIELYTKTKEQNTFINSPFVNAFTNYIKSRIPMGFELTTLIQYYTFITLTNPTITIVDKAITYKNLSPYELNILFDVFIVLIHCNPSCCISLVDIDSNINIIYKGEFNRLNIIEESISNLRKYIKLTSNIHKISHEYDIMNENKYKYFTINSIHILYIDNIDYNIFTEMLYNYINVRY